MTLAQFLSTLTTAGIQVTIKDVVTGGEIAIIKAGGYSALDDEIEARTVAQWSVISTSQLTVLLNKAEEQNPATGTGY